MFKQHFIKYHDITENTYPRTMALSRHHTLFWYYSVGVIRKLKQMCTKIEYQIKKIHIYRQYKQKTENSIPKPWYCHQKVLFLFVSLILKLFRNSNPRMRKVPMTGDLPTQTLSLLRLCQTIITQVM